MSHDSLVETHQLFAIPLAEIALMKPQGRISAPKLADILEGARLLFS